MTQGHKNVVDEVLLKAIRENERKAVQLREKSVKRASEGADDTTVAWFAAKALSAAAMAVTLQEAYNALSAHFAVNSFDQK